jgi:RNA polymerase sporulation-specific sigma factor
MHLRRNARCKAELSIDEPLNVDWDGNELLLSDILGTDEDMVYRNLEEELDLSLLEQALSVLTDKERMIIELRFGLGDAENEMTQKEVADLLGISQSYISRLEKKIIKRLKREINKLSQ